MVAAAMLVTMAPSTGTDIDDGVAEPAAPQPKPIPVPRQYCSPRIAPAALHMFDVPCASAWEECPPAPGGRVSGNESPSVTADTPTRSGAAQSRKRRDLSVGLASCTVHIALAVSLFRRLIASVSPSQRWDLMHFDFVYTQAQRRHDLGMPRADPYVARAFIEAVTRNTRPDNLSGISPRVWPQNPHAPLPGLDRIGWLDLEAASARAIPHDPAATVPAVIRPDHPPDVRTHLPGMSWFGIYGWQLGNRPWTEFNTPLLRRGGTGRWTLDQANPLTAELVESGATVVSDQARQRIAHILLGWREQYRSRAPGTAAEQRLASAGLNAVESAIAAAQVPAYWSTVLLVIRHRNRVVAVLHGSLGAFGRNLARIHAVAVPATTILTPYAEDAVLGAVPYALSRFANYARLMNAAYLIAMTRDDPSTLPNLQAAPHREWVEATLPPSPDEPAEPAEAPEHDEL